MERHSSRSLPGWDSAGHAGAAADTGGIAGHSDNEPWCEEREESEAQRNGVLLSNGVRRAVAQEAEEEVSL
jgi:hypothetical protein